MSLGDLTKQIAKEALGAQVDELMGGSKAAEGGKGEPGAGPAGEGPAALIMAEVQKMQAALKDDRELLVQCVAAGETLRVVEMFAPSDRVLVLTGLDADRVVTRVGGWGGHSAVGVQAGGCERGREGGAAAVCGGEGVGGAARVSRR